MKGLGYIKDKNLGYIEIIEELDGISEINFIDQPMGKEILTKEVEKCKNQVMEYLNKERKTFSVKLDIRRGTEFQKKCWEALKEIKYGETISYQEEALRIGNIKAVRAVGGANGKNPISIIVP